MVKSERPPTSVWAELMILAQALLYLVVVLAAAGLAVSGELELAIIVFLCGTSVAVVLWSLFGKDN